MRVRSVYDQTAEVDGHHEDVVRRMLDQDGAVVIPSSSNIAVPMNSLNLVQARDVHGQLGFTTFQFLEKDIFMSPAVGEVLFSLHPYYTLGCSKLLIPIPQFKDTTLREYGAYVATLFGGLEDSGVQFYLTLDTARSDRVEVSVNGGDILVCTNKIRRTIPQTRRGTAFISETFYFPPHLPSVRPDDKMSNDYLLQAKGELEKEPDGTIIWKREKFFHRVGYLGERRSGVNAI